MFLWRLIILSICSLAFASEEHYKVAFDALNQKEAQKEVLICSKEVKVDGKKYPINFTELLDIKDCGDKNGEVYDFRVEDRGLGLFMYADVWCAGEKLYAIKLDQNQQGDLSVITEKSDNLKESDEEYGEGWFKTVSFKDGDISYIPDYAKGRLLGSTTYLMPDHRTLYIADGKKGLLFMFLADRPNSFDTGRLYVAKKINNEISWIDLGHGSTKQIAKFIETKNELPDIIASRVEPIEYALANGASASFEGVSGISYDIHRNKLFISIDSSSEHPCGALFSLKTGGNKKSTYADRIKSGFVAYNITTLLSKEELAKGCTSSDISNPGRIAFINGSDSLVISKKTKDNQNFVWSYDLLKQRSTKIKSLKKGSEIEYLLWSPKVGNHGYMFSVVGYIDSDGTKNLKIGYTGPFPYMP